MKRLQLQQILKIPTIYVLFQKIVRGKGEYRFITRYVRSQPGNSVLDIGCGPASILEHMPDVKYVGFDLDDRSIRMARKRFGTRAEFFCANVAEATLKQRDAFDLVIAAGVLHHLSEEEAEALLNLAASALAPGGRVITWDCCYVERQSSLSRFLMDKDRGQYVRTEKGYAELAHKTFEHVEAFIDYDLVRIPDYPCLVMELSQPQQRS
jgi:SAM-dependent methyltransferase